MKADACEPLTLASRADSLWLGAGTRRRLDHGGYELAELLVLGFRTRNDASERCVGLASGAWIRHGTRSRARHLWGLRAGHCFFPFLPLGVAAGFSICLATFSNSASIARGWASRSAW